MSHRRSSPLQMCLLGEDFSLPEARFAQIAVGDLPLQFGLPPEGVFVQSVARFGVIEPVVLLACAGVDPGSGERLLVNGRRRVWATRMLGLPHIPALIYDFEPRWHGQLELITSLLTVSLNALRRDNPLADLQAIAALRAKSASDQDIRQVTGMPLGRIRRREALARLQSGLLEALRAGRIGIRLAERCAGLPTALQTQLHERLQTCGRLSGRDLEQVREVRLQSAQTALTLAGFDDLLRGAAPVPEAMLAEIANVLSPSTARRVAAELPYEARFAAARPGLAQLHVFPEAGHVKSWNVSHVAYERYLINFLRPVAK